MTVTDVKTQKNNLSRVNVFVDGKYLFSLDEVDALVMGIKKGREITDCEISECLKKSDVAKARNTAIELISRKTVTRKTVFDLLKQKKYHETVADEVCRELEELGYIDDKFFAKTFLEYASEKMWGERKIRYELILKGVGNEIIDDVLSDYDCISPEKVADAVFQKYGREDFCDMKVRAKVQRYLASRGFDYSVITSAINICTKRQRNDANE